MKNTTKTFRKTLIGLLIAFAILFSAALASFGGMFTASASTTSLSGSGTSDDPFLIASEDDLKSISSVSGLTNYGTYYYFKLTEDITITGNYSNGYMLQVFQGELNGNGHTITSSTNFVYFTLYTSYNATFKNIKIEEKGGSGFFGLVCYGGMYGNTGNLASSNWELTFSKVTIDSVDRSYPVQLENNDSPFVAIVYDGFITFDQCENYATLNYQGYGGIFLGGYTMGAKVVYSSCINYGNVTGVHVGFFNGNTHNDLSTIKLVSSQDKDVRVSGYTTVYVAGCLDLGNISGSTTCTPFATNTGATRNEEANSSLNGTQFISFNGLVVNNYLGSLALALNNNGEVVITGAVSSSAPTVGYYVISYYIQFGYYDGSISRGSSYIKVNKQVAYDGTVGYVSAIVSDSAYEGDLSSGTVIYENYQNVKCTLVGGTLVVDSESLVDVYQEFDPTVDSYRLNSGVPVYSVTAYKADGTIICCYTVAGGLN